MLKSISFYFIILLLIPLWASPSRTLVPSHKIHKCRNGVEIFHFPAPTIPLFELELVYSLGGDSDPKGLSGLSHLSIAMLRRSAEGMDENTILRKLDDLATSVDVSVSEERTALSTYGLNENAFEIINLFFKIIKTASFPAKTFQRIQANYIDNISTLPENPSMLSSYIMDLILFNGTVKARPTSGLLEDLKKIQLGDIKKCIPTILRTDRLKVLLIGGDESTFHHIIREVESLPCSECGKQTASLQEWTFDKWNASKGSVILVDRPGTSEAHVRMGFRGPHRKVPEFYDLRVAETILSGHYSSRLNSFIREKLKLTYSIDGSFNFGRTEGTFTVSTATQNSKIGILLKAVNSTLLDFSKGEIKPEEIQAAKDYLIGSFPLGLQSIYAVASSYFYALLGDLEPTFFDTYVEKIQKVDVESLKESIKKYFKLNEMVTVIVGDRKAIAPKLKQEKIKFTEKDAKIYL